MDASWPGISRLLTPCLEQVKGAQPKTFQSTSGLGFWWAAGSCPDFSARVPSQRLERLVRRSSLRNLGGRGPQGQQGAKGGGLHHHQVPGAHGLQCHSPVRGGRRMCSLSDDAMWQTLTLAVCCVFVFFFGVGAAKAPGARLRWMVL